jgi:hypothetical protein
LKLPGPVLAVAYEAYEAWPPRELAMPTDDAERPSLLVVGARREVWSAASACVFTERADGVMSAP